MLAALKKNRVAWVTLGLILIVAVVLLRGMEPKVAASVLLSGLTLSALYFLVASGLSLIFGLMDVLNFAHGALFVLGAYVGLSTYMNPRLLFNTLPFFFALAGSALLVQHFGRAFWQRVTSKEVRRWLPWLLAGLALLIMMFGLRRFPIRPLNAFSITAVGGAVPTARAQEPLGLMFQRLTFVLLAGIPLGLLLASGESDGEVRRRPLWQTLLIALGLIALAYGMLAGRDVGETFMLALSPDVRFVLALIFGSLAGALAGTAIEMGLIRPFYGSPVTQLVLTLGLSIAAIDLIEAVWGEEANPPMEPPSLFASACKAESIGQWLSEGCRSIDVLGRAFPTYRLFIIIVGLVAFLGIGLLLKRTRLGMIIRAGVQDSDMVQALGINVRRVFTLVFAFGSGLAALGGVIAAPYLGVFPAMGALFVMQAFIAVVIGGMGSYVGAAVGTLLLGLARAFGDHLVAAGISLPFLAEPLKGSPSIARASTVLIMVIVLLVRPAGIFGKKE